MSASARAKPLSFPTPAYDATRALSPSTHAAHAGTTKLPRLGILVQPPKPSPGNSKKRASSSSGSGEDEDGGDGDDEEERARKAAKVAPKGFSELKGLMETMEQPAPRRGRRGNY